MLYIQLGFEWDEEKAEINVKKHQVSFPEAVSTWRDGNALEAFDENYNLEERWIKFGVSSYGRLLCVIYCERKGGASIRIVSARVATKNEEAQYFERFT